MAIAQESEKGARSSKLNLKYLVSRQEVSGTAWQIAVGCALAIVFLGLLLWWGYAKRSELALIHEVSADDSVRSLALHYYDDPNAWQKIFAANRNQLLQGKNVVNYGLHAGQKLKIPMSPAQFAKFRQKQAKNKIR